MDAFPLLGAKLHMNRIMIEECCRRDKSKMVVVGLRIGGDFTISGEISMHRSFHASYLERVQGYHQTPAYQLVQLTRWSERHASLFADELDEDFFNRLHPLWMFPVQGAGSCRSTSGQASGTIIMWVVDKR